MPSYRRFWLLDLPSRGFVERDVSVNPLRAKRWVETIRGEIAESPLAISSKHETGLFGEDLVGGWLLENGGLVEGLRKWQTIPIPEGGNALKRKVDWVLGKRIVVEVKTHSGNLSKGGYLDNTRQFEDYSLWRDEAPSERAIRALNAVVVLLLDLLLGLALALQIKRVVLNSNFDVLRINAGKFRLQDNSLLGLVNVDRRSPRSGGELRLAQLGREGFPKETIKISLGRN
jgi:hypothetical protein